MSKVDLIMFLIYTAFNVFLAFTLVFIIEKLIFIIEKLT